VIALVVVFEDDFPVGRDLIDDAPADAQVRIKDIADIKGLRENQIVGYGLVIGLNGTGDTLRNAPFTEQSLQSMLDNMGINVRNENNQSGGSRPTTRTTWPRP